VKSITISGAIGSTDTCAINDYSPGKQETFSGEILFGPDPDEADWPRKCDRIENPERMIPAAFFSTACPIPLRRKTL
jgi:hypothetical protein